MLRLTALAAAGLAAAASPLSDALAGVQFLNEGLVESSDLFGFSPIASQYLEAENVSYLSSWGAGGAFPYLFATNGSAPPYACKALGPIQPDTDRPGGDLDAVELPGGDVNACQARCCATAGCAAFVYAASAPAVFMNCAAGSRCCYLKGSAVAPAAAAGLQSGTVTPAPGAGGAAPPLSGDAAQSPAALACTA